MPPARTNPAPSAAAVAVGRWARTLPLTSVASFTSARSESTAVASCSRSDSSSRRTCSVVRLFVVAIRLQRLCRELGLVDRLLRYRGRAALHPLHAEQREDAGDEEEKGGDDQERGPPREERREAGGDRREQEADGVDEHEHSAAEEPEAEAECCDLLLELQLRE